jgi:hypothetical protein
LRPQGNVVGGVHVSGWSLLGMTYLNRLRYRSWGGCEGLFMSFQIQALIRMKM